MNRSELKLFIDTFLLGHPVNLSESCLLFIAYAWQDMHRLIFKKGFITFIISYRYVLLDPRRTTTPVDYNCFSLIVEEKSKIYLQLLFAMDNKMQPPFKQLRAKVGFCCFSFLFPCELE